MIKHVEPLGSPAQAQRLLQTQKLLGEKVGPGRVTVLGTGPLALPFRSVLATRNVLDYLAKDASWAAAVGQRLLDDAVREERAPTGRARLGILGSRIVGSRSPRIHLQPFDRIDLPEDAPVGELVDALLPHYAGFAVTSPFKKPIAQHVRSPLEAVNTLIRRQGRWVAENTDVAGAQAVLQRMTGREVLVLGDGGVTAALRMAQGHERTLRVLKRAELQNAALPGSVVWTWPAQLEAPSGLSFRGAEVAIVSYGASARKIAAEIRQRGGEPVMLGARWFVAQARKQRELWETA